MVELMEKAHVFLRRLGLHTIVLPINIDESLEAEEMQESLLQKDDEIAELNSRLVSMTRKATWTCVQYECIETDAIYSFQIMCLNHLKVESQKNRRADETRHLSKDSFIPVLH